MRVSPFEDRMRMHTLKRTGVLVLCLLATSCGAFSSSEAVVSRLPGTIPPGGKAPEIDGIDSSGTPLRLSEQRGKVVMLTFWHST
jgi:hypothetical protein